MWAWAVVIVGGVVGGCGGDAGVGVGVGEDAGEGRGGDAGVGEGEDAGVGEGGGEDVGEDLGEGVGEDVGEGVGVGEDVGEGEGVGEGDTDELDARSYCELTVDLFCPYYLRCGRMAVAELATCRDVFLESCNARYEPVYAALADRSELSLSRAGIARCGEHLATVACEQQIFDLDGGCDAVWVGQVGAGDAEHRCGLGIESFVCDAASTCVIGLDFCGDCVSLAGPNDACDLEHRCADDATCDDGRCVPRAAVGEACDDAVSCVRGASCVRGSCAPPTIVAVDEACDAARRCPYRAACVSGRCVATGLLGEACGAAGCASGACSDGTCVPLLDPGATCTTHAACLSGRCEEGRCGSLTSPCLQ